MWSSNSWKNQDAFYLSKNLPHKIKHVIFGFANFIDWVNCLAFFHSCLYSISISFLQINLLPLHITEVTFNLCIMQEWYNVRSRASNNLLGTVSLQLHVLPESGLLKLLLQWPQCLLVNSDFLWSTWFAYRKAEYVPVLIFHSWYLVWDKQDLHKFLCCIWVLLLVHKNDD